MSNHYHYKTVSPSATPSETPYASPTDVPTTTPEPTSSADPSASTEPTPRPTEGSNGDVGAPNGTDLSDGQSDGRTDSLGCQKPSDNCNTQITDTPVQILPSTGSDSAMIVFTTSVILLVVGVVMIVKSYRK